MTLKILYYRTSHHIGFVVSDGQNRKRMSTELKALPSQVVIDYSLSKYYDILLWDNPTTETYLNKEINAMIETIYRTWNKLKDRSVQKLIKEFNKYEKA